jgi:hypothetical protein
LALGIYTLPFPTACQILDLFFLDGELAIRKLIINSLMLYEEEILLTEDPLELYTLVQKDALSRAIKEYGLRKLYLS